MKYRGTMTSVEYSIETQDDTPHIAITGKLRSAFCK